VVTVWDKIDPSVLRPPEPDTGTGTPEKTSPSDEVAKTARKANRRRRWGIADVIGALTWTYVIVKLFVIDFDRLLIVTFAPSLEFLLDYKFFFILIAFTALVAWMKKKALVLVLYVMFWPFVVAFCKIPRLAYKFRSWNLLLVVMNVGHSFVQNFRWNLVVRTGEILALLGISVSSSRWVVYPCLVVVSLGLLLHYFRAARAAVQPSRLLTMQQHFVEKLFNDSEGLRKATCIHDEWRSVEVEKLNKQQVEQFANNVSLGITLWKYLEYYTVLLNRYRKSAAPIVFGFSAFLWLFVQSTVAITFLNFGLGKAHPSQYDGAAEASFIRYIYYSINSLYGNTIPQLSPVGDAATGLGIVAVVYGPVLLLTFVAQAVFGFRQTRDDVAFQDFATKIRKIRLELEERLEAEYEVTLEEAWRRLEELGIGTVSQLTELAAMIPIPDDLDDEQRDKGSRGGMP